MKTIKAKSYFIQVLLIAIASMIVTFGVILSAKSLVFTTANWGYLSHGELKETLVLGVIPVLNLSLFLGFIFIYLNFEFYGLKVSFYNTLSVCLVVLLSSVILKLFIEYGLNVAESEMDQIIATFLTVRDEIVIITIVAIAIGYTLSLLVASALKKLTRNYFMFFRYPIAAIMGFAFVATLLTYIHNKNVMDYSLFSVQAATPAAQFLILIVGSLIPLYALRIILSFFRGRPEKSIAKNAEDVSTENEDDDENLFKAATPDDLLPPPQESKNTETPQPEEKQEITVSQKIDAAELEKVAND
jgi:hypothetical protein